MPLSNYCTTDHLFCERLEHESWSELQYMIVLVRSYYKGELTVTLIDFPVTLVFNFWKFRTLSLTTVLPCRTTQDIKSHHSHLMITVGIKAQVKQKYVSVPRYVYLPILEPVFDGRSLNQNAFNWPLCVVMKENPKISSQ